MVVDPKDILENLAKDDYLRDIILNAKGRDGPDVNQRKVASVIALMRTISKQSEKITGSLDELGRSLVESARAAEAHAKSLRNATYGLFGATIVLAIATIILAIKA